MQCLQRTYPRFAWGERTDGRPCMRRCAAPRRREPPAFTQLFCFSWWRSVTVGVQTKGQGKGSRKQRARRVRRGMRVGTTQGVMMRGLGGGERALVMVGRSGQESAHAGASVLGSPRSSVRWVTKRGPQRFAAVEREEMEQVKPRVGTKLEEN